jgi:hypothetical protein
MKTYTQAPYLHDEKSLYSSAQIPYGLDANEELVHITKASNGKRCCCVCPGCRQPLIARNRGKKRIPYFAHAPHGNDRVSCDSGFETAIHYAAKKILSGANQIKLPAVREKVLNQGEEWIISDERTFHYRNVRVEKNTRRIRPDIILYGSKHKLAVEVAVTHFCDEAKKEAFADMRLPAVEIQLHDQRIVSDEKAFEKTIVEYTDRKEWLFNRIKEGFLKQIVRASTRLRAENSGGTFRCPAKCGRESSVHGNKVFLVSFKKHCLKCPYLGSPGEKEVPCIIRCFASSGVLDKQGLEKFIKTGETIPLRHDLLPKQVSRPKPTTSYATPTPAENDWKRSKRIVEVGRIATRHNNPPRPKPVSKTGKYCIKCRAPAKREVNPKSGKISYSCSKNHKHPRYSL